MSGAKEGCPIRLYQQGPAISANKKTVAAHNYNDFVKFREQTFAHLENTFYV